MIDHVTLAREIAARMAPDSLLDSDDVGALLKCSARNVTERLAKVAGFPRAIHLGGTGQPRWQRSDVMLWVAKHKIKAGRPRNTD